MQRAAELARKHRTHPNPRVGAVVVSSAGEVLGVGAHRGPGEPHAEAVALEGVDDAKGATVYVTLEPCSHFGRTPPCADLLVGAGVGRVVVGAIDPDPRVAGAGIAKLESAGIGVEVVEHRGSEDVDPGYFHHRRTGEPLVTLKYAMTADGSVAAQDGSSRWITGLEAREDAHRLRAASDVVVVGAGTLMADDPRLDVRLDGFEGPQPRPVVVAGATPLPVEARIWEREPVVFASADLSIPSGELVRVEGDRWPTAHAICEALSAMGHYDVLLEGGPKLASSFWNAGAVDRIIVYVGAQIGAGSGRSPFAATFQSMEDASSLDLVSVRHLGTDVRIEYMRNSDVHRDR